MNRNNKVNKEQHSKAAGNQEDLTGEIVENEGFYVDSFRNVSVSLGSKDLRSTMCEKAREVKDPLSHNPEVYYRQAQYFHSKLDCTNTLLYLSLALDASSKEDAPNIGSLIMAKQAQSLARLGDFHLSRRAAEVVLRQDPDSLEAILIKAESLYNNCEFEHAMVVFNKGLRISAGFEGFLTGIAKCRKTIQNTLYQEGAFKFTGINLLLGMLRVDLDLDPDTIEYMIGNKERAKLTEEEEASLKKQSTKRIWLNLATKLVMSTSQLSTCVKQISKDPRPRRTKYVDRLKNDKKYLRKEIK